MDRRRFVVVSAGAVVAAGLPACASLVATAVTPVDGVVRLPLRNFPRLEQPAGSLKIIPAGQTTPVYVLNNGGGRYAALSALCTHLQCFVNVEGGVILCPCHGSTFDREGRVLRGPAERPLRSYATTLTPDGDLVIELGTAA
jgi:Rieske Fe-S protein